MQVVHREAEEQVAQVDGQLRHPLRQYWLVVHFLLHLPQLNMSVWRFTQELLQLVRPTSQRRLHAPSEHTAPGWHTTPHAPHW